MHCDLESLGAWRCQPEIAMPARTVRCASSKIAACVNRSCGPVRAQMHYVVVYNRRVALHHPFRRRVRGERISQMNTTIQTEVPAALLQQAQLFVERGWAGNVQELLAESLRRYLESHQETLLEQYVQADVDWGLHGDD